jgi:hypothetical protein
VSEASRFSYVGRRSDFFQIRLGGIYFHIPFMKTQRRIPQEIQSASINMTMKRCEAGFEYKVLNTIIFYLTFKIGYKKNGI